MFGYVTINEKDLSEEARKRYHAYYCGLCHQLKRRYGEVGQMTLSYDMTFLWILLSGLYEPEEHQEMRRCVLHPLKRRMQLKNELAGYACDMNIALSYHKLQDDMRDEKRSAFAAGQVKFLQNAYRQVAQRYPVKCALIQEYLSQIAAMEKEASPSPDALANLTGQMLAEIYAWREDEWSSTLREMGAALGRFIYFMDAYEDFPQDQKKGRFNPLTGYHAQEDYEELMRAILTMMISQCAQAFERLPILQDVEILRNVLYSGVWARYAAVQARREKEKKK